MAAYVFGSVATSRVRPGSDVDVAVLLDSRVRLSQMLNYRLKLMAELRSHLINTGEHIRPRGKSRGARKKE